MKFIKIEDLSSDHQIKIVSFSRPEMKNAFHPEMISELTVTFQNFQSDMNLKAVVLKGEGSVFCSGADLNWMKKMVNYSFEENLRDSEKLWDMFHAMILCPVPLIGFVQGAAYGGAMGLLACCDYVFAEPDVKFSFSEVKLGLAPAIISSFVLRKISDGAVRPLMLSAEVFSTKTAIQVGLVHQEIANLDTAFFEQLKVFSSNGLEAMKETKKLLNQIKMGLSWPEQRSLTTKLISERRTSEEAQSRLKKFFEKS